MGDGARAFPPGAMPERERIARPPDRMGLLFIYRYAARAWLGLGLWRCGRKASQTAGLRDAARSGHNPLKKVQKRWQPTPRGTARRPRRVSARPLQSRSNGCFSLYGGACMASPCGVIEKG
jgi:hypothetical protein